VIEASWLLFLAASLVVIITPGQDMVLVMSRSVVQGAAAGVATAAGVSVGLLGHTLLATLGLAAVMRASEGLFVALKLIGAAYLLYLGIRFILTKSADLHLRAASRASLRRRFVEGALSNLSNPKIAIFYLAFLPQFVPPSSKHASLSVFALGVAFAVLTFLIKGPVGLFAGGLSEWLRSRPQVLAWVYRSSGVVLVGLGVRLALEERR
jgi:threonine/homoserine/homoserine lactone efflux protein